MILHRPGPVERAADIAEWGEWVWCFWRRVGEKVIVLQWARRKVEDIDNSRYRVTWRKSDHTIISTDTYTNQPGW